jgi:hypothetical protein
LNEGEGFVRSLTRDLSSFRWTDSPIHDPYAATNGLWWAHCGWIFRKPIYPRMKLIERADLEADPGESKPTWDGQRNGGRADTFCSRSLPASALHPYRPVLGPRAPYSDRVVGMG